MREEMEAMLIKFLDNLKEDNGNIADELDVCDYEDSIGRTIEEFLDKFE